MTKLLWLGVTIPVMSVLMSAAAAEETHVTLSALLIAIVVIILLVLLNGLYVSAEFSIIGVRPTQLEQMVDEGNTPGPNMFSISWNHARNKTSTSPPHSWVSRSPR
jgi:hypothetical protein